MTLNFFSFSDVVPDTPTIADLIKCAERELALRERVYPKLVLKGKMRIATANREIVLMKEIVEQLKQINRAKERFR
jgi:hypothetical protein